ncbi:MAG: response regulator [Patescibacteria group bacterium]|nr:response regulator [Patescibacteria group bacterium]
MNPDKAVLHIDDDPQVTRIVGARLKSHGYQVTSINDARMALRELMQNQWRVVLLDIDMPGVNGLDLLREIKAYDGGIQVIMLTGVTSMSALLQSFRFGAEACLFKPLHDYQPLFDVLEDTFRKIDRWWDALEELSQRRCEERSVLVGAP